MENVAGVPASTNTSANVPGKKVNPARASRLKLRLEEFMNPESRIEPVKGSKVDAAAGDASQLITKLPLVENTHVEIESGLNCPIPQLNGLEEERDVHF